MTFAEAVRDILAEAAAAPERPTPGSLVERISRQAERYLRAVRFDATHYVRHPVLFWEDWEIMMIGWESGQITPIHDHRGVLGGMAVLSGSLVEERFATPALVPELADSRTRAEGDLSETGATVLHRLIPKTARAVSLHVYRPPLRTMGIWNESGLIEIRPSRFEVGEEVLARAIVGPAAMPADPLC
ncbi:MAG TPA: cysteine dioxygenase family protein [Thermoanaerobaculia bacterium]|nr:cysteine dioxygenase family protein [Thermoanaerobaculia bacterium]